MKKRRTGPSFAETWDMMETTSALAAIVACLGGKGREKAAADFERIAARLVAGDRRVWGNRKSSQQVLWADHRLLIASRLRILLEEVEGTPCSPTNPLT